ncbi:MAG: hypothetical protein OXE57_07750 [Alphaproteobacteria bacterium]|nr:hypothetical protein [Alphaproteobacteria bacterium]
MSPTSSRDAAPVFAGVVFLFGGMAILAGAPRPAALTLVVLAWACGALWRIGSIDGQRLRIDPWWLFLLVGAGALRQAQTVGPDAEEGLMRAMAGAVIGFLVGAVPLVIAEAFGRRWPFQPGDVLLFAALGWLLGPWGLLWALPVGSASALARHALVQRRRGRSWLQGHVPLGPGMAVGAALVLAVTALDRAGLGLG